MFLVFYTSRFTACVFLSLLSQANFIGVHHPATAPTPAQSHARLHLFHPAQITAPTAATTPTAARPHRLVLAASPSHFISLDTDRTDQAEDQFAHGRAAPRRAHIDHSGLRGLSFSPVSRDYGEPESDCFFVIVTGGKRTCEGKNLSGKSRHWSTLNCMVDWSIDCFFYSYYSLIDWLMIRLIDRLIDPLIDWLIVRLIDWLIDT